jgi:hypothetical protein
MPLYYIWLALLLLSVSLLVLARLPPFARLLERKYGGDTCVNIQETMVEFAAGLFLVMLVAGFFYKLIAIAAYEPSKETRSQHLYQWYENAKAETFEKRLGKRGFSVAHAIEVEQRVQRLEDMLSEVMRVLTSIHEHVQECEVKPSEKAVAGMRAQGQTCAWQQE